MQVALIHARVSYNNVPPLGLLSIASVLNADGIEVKVWDPGLDDDDFFSEISKFQPNVIGISVLTAQYQRAKEIIQILRKKLPQAFYVCGGVHVSALSDKSLVGLDVDAVVVGEGEFTMLELCKLIQDNRNWRGVKGLVFRTNSKIKRNAPRPLIGNLDAIPFKGRKFLSSSFEWYLMPPGVLRGMFHPRTTTMMTSRGCPYNCIFCASKVIFGHQIRRRSVTNVIDEINYLKQRYAVKGVWFLDDCFISDRAWCEDFCLSLKRNKLNITWSCQARVGHLDEELVRLMITAGCAQLELGIESGSDKVLSALSKGTNVQMIKRKFDFLKRLPIRIAGTFMIGNPEEGIGDIMATYRLAQTLKLDYVQFGICTPYPGTPLYYMAKKKGWLGDDIDFNHNWSEHFTSSPVMSVGLNAQDLLALRAKFQNHFICGNYKHIISGFLTYPKGMFLLFRAFFLFLRKRFIYILRLLRKGKLDILVWDIYAEYSMIVHSPVKQSKR